MSWVFPQAPIGAGNRSPGPWRVGRKVGRTIYDANERLIGVMDTVEDARAAATFFELMELASKVATGWCGVRRLSNQPCADPDCLQCVAFGLVLRLGWTP
jgi:hypothetical protein